MKHVERVLAIRSAWATLKASTQGYRYHHMTFKRKAVEAFDTIVNSEETADETIEASG